MSKDILIKALSIVVCLCLGLVIGSFIFDGKFEAEVAEDTIDVRKKQHKKNSKCCSQLLQYHGNVIAKSDLILHLLPSVLSQSH